MRVVATLTSVPGRQDILIKACRSIANQTIKPDVIYLTIPKLYKRMNTSYGEIPDEIRELCTIVDIPDDYGPITKIYGGISQENDPETIIISCDDDIEYPMTTFEELLNKSKLNPDSCICGSGMLFSKGLFMSSVYTNISTYQPYNGFLGFIPPKNGRKVDLIFGSSGVLYKRNFFPSLSLTIKEMFNIAFIDDSVFCNDDVLISAYLGYRGITKLTFPGFSTVKVIEGENPEVALSFDIIKTSKRMNKSIYFLHNIGYLTSYEQLSVDEISTINFIIFIIVFIIMIFLIFVMWKTLFKPIDYNDFTKIFYI